MRLLRREKSGWLADSYTFRLVDCNPRDNLQYAILSHRWGKDEVTYQDISSGTMMKKPGGYKKLEFCAEQASRDGLTYFWVDTCCIDKTNNTELSTAINSMYKWYQNAAKCYVYLPDVSTKQQWETALRRSEWFGRGWTLQELIAPRVVEFFSVEGTMLGTKRSLKQQIHQITGVSIEALEGKPLVQISQLERFSWTARRETTVEEDSVYCLLGLFNVHMPLLYGEGKPNALARLQREIRLLENPDLYAIKDAAWIVPFERNRRFAGRESQLIELETKLANKTNKSRIAVMGLGGIGKTQLVLELLYRIRERQTGCSVIWISANSVESIEQGYLAVAQQLNIAGCEDPAADVKRLVQDHLSNNANGPWVLVYDNADDVDLWTAVSTSASHMDSEDEAQVSLKRPKRLIDYLPRNARGSIIFTTRNKKVAVMLASANVVTVPAMSEEAAAQLLTASLIDPSLSKNSQDVSQLLAALTYLPLAIAQATAYINANGITLADYISLLEGKEEEVIDVLSEDFEDYGRYQDIKNPIATTWLISFEQIRRSDPLAAEYLSFMACVHPRDIPQSLLPPGPSRKKEIDAIGMLSAYSFVSQRPSYTTLDLHRLVHLATRNWLRKENSLRGWTERAVSRLETVLPENDHENRAVWRMYLPHVQQVLLSDLVNEEEEQRMKLMWRYGKCLHSDGRWNEAEAVFTKLLALLRRAFGEESDSVLDGRNWLAATYAYQGCWSKAEQLWVQVLETQKTKLGTDHPYTLITMNNLASTYRDQGRWAEAEQLELQVLKTRKTKLGANHHDTLTSMSDLASTYSDQGRWAEAEELELQVLEIRRTNLGTGHPDTLLTMTNLACTYRDQSRWAEAEQLDLQVLETRKTKLGADHPDTLTSMNNLASTYADQGRWAEAEELQLQVLEMRKTKLGVDHPNILTSMNNLASTYRDQGRWTEAEKLELQVLETRKTKLGVDHPLTLMSMHNLACTWKLLKRDDQAIQLMRECVQAQNRVLGATHPHSILSCETLVAWEAEGLATTDEVVNVEAGP